MPHAEYHREQARRCREIAASCEHDPTSDALYELAEEYERRADWIDAGMIRPNRERSRRVAAR